MKVATGPEALTSDQQLLVLKALTSEVGRLDKPSCNNLISNLLSLKWSKESPEFQNAYARFLTVLVSGVPRWWKSVAQKLVSEFTRANTEMHHSVFKFILDLLPTATTSLPDLFAKAYPHKSDPTNFILRYISNLLAVVEYAPEVRSSVWALIMERTVELDVELQDDDDDDDDDVEVDDEDEDEDEENEGTKNKTDGPTLADIQAMGGGESDSENDDDDDDDDNVSEMSEYDVEDLGMSASAVRSKLDSVMSLLLNYLDNCFSASEIESGDGQSLFVTLQNLFKTYILSTYRTRSVQYLLFWASHANPLLMDAFLASLLETALSPREDMEKRLKAMQYISSFIARAKGLSQTQIVFVISILASWLDRYVQEREIEVDTMPGGMGRFRMFYSVVQTIMYIFCFRHAMLKKEPSANSNIKEDNDEDVQVKSSADSAWECDLDKLFRRLIITKFNPLRYCRRTVVAMFAQIARKEDLVYCFTIMEQNRLGKNSHHPQANQGNRMASQSANAVVGDVLWKRSADFVMLDAYFPFDPLHLPQCRQRIQTLYLEWAEVADDSDSASEYDEDEEDDEDDDDDNDDNEGEESVIMLEIE